MSARIDYEYPSFGRCVMKKFAALALLLGLFAVGCEKPKDAAPATDAAPAADAAPAEGAAEAPAETPAE